MLPFDNLSPDAEADEYFVDGIHDEIMAQLSKIGGLKVISRTSVMRYKGSDKPLPEIAAELGVAAVLEGTVRRAGGQLRITAQLIDAASDEHLWSATYDRELSEIFAIQSDVALQIARALQARLSPTERQRITRKPTESLEAYDLYLKGRYFFLKPWTEESVRKSIEYFTQAGDRQPDFALAYVGLANAYAIIGCCSSLWEDRPPAEAYERAREAAWKALQIDDAVGEAHEILAFVELTFDLDWAAAERRFRRAIELSPNDGWAHTRYGILLTALGRHDEAVERTRLAVEVDPLSSVISQDLAWALLYAGRYDEAVAQAERAIELDPESPMPRVVLAEAFLGQGRYDEAIAALRWALERSPRGTSYLAKLAYAYAASGNRARAEELARELQNRSKAVYVSPLSLAIVHAALGESDQAINWLERALETGDGWRTLARGPFEFEGLRSHPGFVALMRSIGLPGG